MNKTVIETEGTMYEVIGREKGLETTFEKVLTAVPGKGSAEGFGKIEVRSISDSWTPSNDVHRQVQKYIARGNQPKLFVTRNNKWNKNLGMTARPTHVEAVFEVAIRALQHRIQASLILADGTILTGYVLNKNTNLGLYFPKKFWPKGAPVPSKGERLPLWVSELIIG